MRNFCETCQEYKPDDAEMVSRSYGFEGQDETLSFCVPCCEAEYDEPDYPDIHEIAALQREQMEEKSEWYSRNDLTQ